MVLRSKKYFCGLSMLVITGSNSAEGMYVRLVFALCCVDNVLCNVPITCSEESYRVCDVETQKMRMSGPELSLCAPEMKETRLKIKATV